MSLTLDHFIKTYDGALDAASCQNIIDRFNNDDGVIRSPVAKYGVNEDVRKGSELWVTGREGWQDVDAEFSQVVGNTVHQYLNDMGEYAPVIDNGRDLGYKIQMTEPGEYYHWHDDAAGALSANGKHWDRVLVFILYLNDNFKGGRTQLFKEDTHSVEPKTGRILYFPSNRLYQHRGEEVTEGVKYLMTGWIFSEHPTERV